MPSRPFNHAAVSLAALAASALAAPLSAQPLAAEQAAGAGADEGAARDGNSYDSMIVVTGTHIRQMDGGGILPIDHLSSDDLAQSGSQTLNDLFRLLPVSSGVLGDSSQFDGRSQFNQGAASVNLRGLGPHRTLVLLNGKRVAVNGTGNSPMVDVNLLPSAAISRIDVLKDGAASTYGSDAVAGVVNLITRTDQDGFLVSGDYRYIAGSDGDWTGAMAWGGDIGPARLFLSGGYQQRSELRTTDRDFSSRPYAENPQGGWTGGGSPGNFDFGGAGDGLAFVADQGCADLGGYAAPTGLCFNNFSDFSNLVEPEKRFQLFADVQMPLAASTQFRMTALFGRTRTELNTSPSFLPTIAPSQEAAFGGGGLFVIPSYAPALMDYCARFGGDAGCSVAENGLPDQSALAFPVRFRPFLLGGNPFSERGSSRLDYGADAYQFTAELRHDLSSSLSLTASGTFSEYDRRYQVGDSYVDLLQNALAGFGGANCVYATAQSRAGLTSAQLAEIAGTNGCSYFNPFSTGIAANAVTGAANPHFAASNPRPGFDLTPGAGLVNDLATMGHFFNVWDRTVNTQQWVADVALSGGTGLALGGGEVQFALGGQYRRDRHARWYEGGSNLDLFPCPGSVLNADAECAQETGALGFIGSNRNIAVSSDVKAAFAELQLPVAGWMDVQLSARYEDYGGSVGSSFDPQARVRVELTNGVSLRGGVGTTFRGPPPQNTLADQVVLTMIGSSFRAVDVRGNPALTPESATTWNAGLVVERGLFRASVDYWRYDFTNAIENEPVSGIVSALFGATGSANCGKSEYAGLEARFEFAGGVCGVGNVQRLETYNFNSGDVAASGIDAHASYGFDAGGARLEAGIAGTYTLAHKVGAVSVEGIEVQHAYDAAGLLNFQTTAYPLPRWKGQAWLQGQWGAHSLRVQGNFISGYTDQRGASVFGPNSNLGGQSVTAGKRIGSFPTLDAHWQVKLRGGSAMSLSLVNVLDKAPPLARVDQSYDPFTASPLGFTVKLGASHAF